MVHRFGQVLLNGVSQTYGTRLKQKYMPKRKRKALYRRFVGRFVDRVMTYAMTH